MDAAEEIPQGFRPEKRPRVDDETPLRSPTQAVAVTKFLDDENLLREIIVRIGLPTTLVCAALVCKRWLGHASDPKFLIRFRELHPPRLLGYYITGEYIMSQRPWAARFVPMLPQPLELAAVIRRLESYNFGAPLGVKYRFRKSMLSRADDASSVYLINVKAFQLCIWLHKGENWLLVDTICLHEMLANLGMSGHTLENGGFANVFICQVGDNGQFVILRMDECIFYLDIKCRTLCKLYEKKGNDPVFCSIDPFMMIWPPTFPAIKDDPARNAMSR